jgi:enoyl-CoA hydratase/carnithine racemase
MDAPVERVAIVTIDRHDARNALNMQVRRELVDAFETLEASDGV